MFCLNLLMVFQRFFTLWEFETSLYFFPEWTEVVLLDVFLVFL